VVHLAVSQEAGPAVHSEEHQAVGLAGVLAGHLAVGPAAAPVVGSDG